MKTCECPTCKKVTRYAVIAKREEIQLNDLLITVPQKHAYCLVCGTEIQMEDLKDENAYVVLHAYCIRKSKGQ